LSNNDVEVFCDFASLVSSLLDPEAVAVVLHFVPATLPDLASINRSTKLSLSKQSVNEIPLDFSSSLIAFILIDEGSVFSSVIEKRMLVVLGKGER
jgi:hypothetical protein